MPRIFQSLIQSDFGTDEHKNFEAVVVEGDSLVHWYRDNGDGQNWKRAKTIVASGVAGAGAIIQSDFVSGGHRNFEVVVPLKTDTGRVELWHFFHDNSNANNEWTKVRRVTGPLDDVAFAASLIQSDYRPGGNGNFEVVVPLRMASGQVELWHFFHDNSDVASEWKSGGRVTSVNEDVAGPASLIQSDYRFNGHGNFEVVVPVKFYDSRHLNYWVKLWHVARDNSTTTPTWVGPTFIDILTGPGVLIQSDFMTGGHGNLEVLAPSGNQLLHFYREFDSHVGSLLWKKGQIVTESANGWASLMRSDYGTGENKNFEALIEECGDSVIGYWHPNVDAKRPWLRDKPMITRSVGSQLSDTRKIRQLTGEYDFEGWCPGQPKKLTQNRTETKDLRGILGTDLGSSFQHGMRTCFLFGDTWWGEVGAKDSIAFTSDTDPDVSLLLSFNPSPPVIRPPIPQDDFDVPLDGISVNGVMFVFFSTDHYKADGSRDMMGRSILAKSTDDGNVFDMLYTFSRDKFINISVQRVQLDRDKANTIFIEPDVQDVLCVWGSGRYRSSDVYLALLPMSQLTTGNGLRYYGGQIDGHDYWPDDETQAKPLFCAGCVGELSVRWNKFMNRFLIMFNSDNPRGIVLHASKTPWGPWSSDPLLVFDPNHHAPGLDPNDPCKGDGYGKFMHVSWKVRRCDFLHHDHANRGEDEWGGEYGPYQIGHMAKGVEGQYTQIYFLMSTWNPYQVVLMTTRLTDEALRQIEQL